jgi:4-hydroxybenzoate polyprenyltransferase
LMNAELIGADVSLRRPLCVELDGSVLRTDVLLEGLLSLLKRNPVNGLWALLWLLRGRARLKAEIERRVPLDATSLPYNRELLVWLRSERERGRQLWLCTGTDALLAHNVARHLGIFEGIISPDSLHTLAGYVSVPVSFARGGHRLRALWRALRPHQWAKNLLLFVPLLAAHRANDTVALGRAVEAFIAFCLCASSVYVLNDLLDLQADRVHERKCKRPFASGDLPLRAGFVLVPTLLAAAAVLAGLLSPTFLAALSSYYLLTSAYSFALKGMIFIDAIALAALYTLRIIAGAAATAVPLSFWLLLFSVFLFLSLAVVKRYAELDALRRRGRLHAAGRDYDIEDLPLMESVGISAGYLSVLILALYINSPSTLQMYRHQQALWPLCLLMLYWVTRMWMKTHRGKMHDDPVVFAMRDPVSLATGLLGALIVGMAM